MWKRGVSWPWVKIFFVSWALGATRCPWRCFTWSIIGLYWKGKQRNDFHSHSFEQKTRTLRWVKTFGLLLPLMSASQSDGRSKPDPDLRPLSQAGSSLAWGRPQIPAETAHFFSSVTETQHPQGPKSQWPEINGFARITWHRASPPSSSSLSLFVQLSLAPPLPPLWSAGWGRRRHVLNSLAAEQQTRSEQEQQTSAVVTSANNTKSSWLQLYADINQELSI